MSQLTELLVGRLEKKGMDPDLIPGFIRNLAKTISVDPETSIFQVNDRLHALGWDDVELDYRTFELATACFEADGLEDLEMEQAIQAG